jgi:hypothetical protein
MPVSKERSLLARLYEQVNYVRFLNAVAKNQEAAQREADAARRTGNEEYAEAVLAKAEEFARAA